MENAPESSRRALIARAETLLAKTKKMVISVPEFCEALDAAHIVWSDRARRWAGRAYFRGKHRGQIAMSWSYFSNRENLWEFDDTVLHEIAHLLIPLPGHPPEWKRVHVLIGGTGRAWCEGRHVPQKIAKLLKLKEEFRDLEESLRAGSG